MTPREKPTFFLYEIGRDPEELCLGNLVLKDYANPTISRHYTHPRLNDDDLKKYARSTQLTKGWEAKYSSGTTFKPSMDHKKTITADEGCRVELKDPENFLREQVLAQADAMRALQIWISGANTGLRALKKKPKIWLLTGIYLLKDATFTGERKRTTGIHAGISSTLLSATGGPPISPSIDLGHSNDLDSRTPTQGRLVWAAQYRALDYRVRLITASASADIMLLNDVVSAGAMFWCTPGWFEGLTVEVTEQSNSLDDGSRSSCDDEDYQKIDENFSKCERSRYLTKKTSVDVPKKLAPEQQAKLKKSLQARKAGREHEQAPADIEPSLSRDQASKERSLAEFLRDCENLGR